MINETKQYVFRKLHKILKFSSQIYNIQRDKTQIKSEVAINKKIK